MAAAIMDRRLRPVALRNAERTLDRLCPCAAFKVGGGNVDCMVSMDRFGSGRGSCECGAPQAQRTPIPVEQGGVTAHLKFQRLRFRMLE